MLAVSDGPAVAAAFGLGAGAELTGPVARGEVGQVWRLASERGAFAVKETFEPPSTEEVEDDAAFQDLVAAAGVPTPGIVRTTAGEVLARIGPASVRVYEWVELLGPDRSVDPAEVGRLVAAIHQVRYHGANGEHWWYTDPVGADAWDDLVDALTAEQAPFASRLAEQRDELVAMERLLEPAAGLQACHRDLFADNVLPTPAGGLCVIDWENCGLADPGQELAVVLFEFGGGDPARVRSAYEAYCESGGPGRVTHPGSFSMAIAQLGHIGELSCRRWLDPSRRLERDRNLARVEEFLTDGITLRLIEQILDAITPRTARA